MSFEPIITKHGIDVHDRKACMHCKNAYKHGKTTDSVWCNYMFLHDGESRVFKKSGKKKVKKGYCLTFEPDESKDKRHGNNWRSNVKEEYAYTNDFCFKKRRNKDVEEE